MDEEAEAAFREAIRINPRYADPYTNLGALFFRRGDTESAIQNWKEALRISPQHTVAQVYMNMAKEQADSDLEKKKG